MAEAVHLVRHGEVDNPDHVVYARLDGFVLSEVGRAQAERAAARLANRPIAAVWCSPLQRALETARVIAEAVGCEPRVDDRLLEWRLADRWAGSRWEDLPRQFPGELEAYLTRPERLPFSPESLQALGDRMRAAVEEAHRRHPEGEVVIVSHQDPIQAARMALTRLEDIHADKPGHCRIITLRPDPWRESETWQP